MAVLTSASFLSTSLLATPLNVLAQMPQKPAFGTPKPIPSPAVHDDPSWHTIDYHAQEHALPSLHSNNVAQASPHMAGISLLDEVGRLASPVDAAKVAEWKHLLHQPKNLASSQAARLHLWLGEYALAQDENPEQALWHFGQAQKLSNAKDAVHGLAAYDSAVATFYEGAYAQAQAAFAHVLTAHPGLHGFDRATCTLFMRHAQACAGYHAERRALGIPEPPRLDPLCGASALASALKTYHKPYDKPTLLRNMRVTGRGSSLQDVLDGAQKLGLSAHVVHVKDAGLILLPKPLVAYVEHDHFVSVTKADKSGVTYLCADCGPWPGGRVSLTWAQWHKMEATAYAVVSKPGSDIDGALSALATPDGKGAQGVQTASIGGKLAGGVSGRVQWMRLLRKQIMWPTGGTTVFCGNSPVGQHCPDYVDCPTDDGPASCSLGAASYGDPVNLATGEEEYHPGADLSVYNPVGPSVTWGRIYNSLRGSEGGYQSDDLGQCWSHTYNIGVITAPTAPQNSARSRDPRLNGRAANCGRQAQGGTAQTVYLIEPNGARVALTAPQVPDAATPHVVCSVQAGVSLLAEWDYDSAGNTTYFVFTLPDRTRWITQGPTSLSSPAAGASDPVNAGRQWFALGQIVDRNANAITLHYNAQVGAPLLTSITDKNNVALLTFNRANNGSGNLTSVADRYGRSVYYHVGTYQNTNTPAPRPQSQQELDHVSQVVPTGTASPPDRYVYGYQNVNNGEGQTMPFLHTLTVPSPTGTGTQTATINYLPNICTVSSLVDANGNTRSYSQPDASHTQVTVKDPQGNVVYRYTAGYDMNMSQTTKTNGAVNANGGNTTPAGSSVYADPNNPYRPSQTQDGNGYAANGANNKGTWEYTWDRWGNCTSMTTPRGTTTTNTLSYQNFALGELMNYQEGAKSPSTYTYYEPSGLVHTVTEPAPGTSGGNATVLYSYTYDTLGNTLTMTTPGNNATAVDTITFNYTTDGNYSQPAAIGQPLTETDNLGHVRHMRFDARGNRVADIDALGNEVDASFNIADQIVSSMQPATGQTGTGRASAVYGFAYTGGPLLTVTSYDESGAQFQQTSYGYDAEGSSTSFTGATTPVYTTYDALYRRKSISDGVHTTTFNYNATGYVSGVTYPGMDMLQYNAYDANGNVLQRTDGRGIVTNYAYNDLESQPTDFQYPASPGLNVHYGYDAYGRRSTASDSTGSKAYAYDDMGATTGITTTYTSLPAQTISYVFNADGSRQSMTTPAGTFAYSYDAAGRATGLTNPYNEAFSWTYLNNDWVWTQSSANAATTTYTYNAQGLMLEVANRKMDAAQTLLSDYGSLHYNAIQKCTSVTASIPGIPAHSGQTNYQFDGHNQLTQEQSARSGSYTSQFGYDAVGNLTTFKGTSSTYNANNQNTAYTYDGNGNPTSYKGIAFAWDAENRDVSIGTTLTNGYDADSRRAWKQSSAGRTYFLYDGSDPVCELNAAGTVVAVNTIGDNGLLARHTVTGSLFYTFDAQGNAAQRLNSSGGVLSASMFDAFGVSVSTAAVNDPFSYGAQAGYYTDLETGLSLLGQRYYDAGAGRFLSRDPMGSDGGVNLYAYTANDPINGCDPSGLIPQVRNCPPSLRATINNSLKKICAKLPTLRGNLGGIVGGKPSTGNVSDSCVRKWCSEGIVQCDNQGSCKQPGNCARSEGGPDNFIPTTPTTVFICTRYPSDPFCVKSGMCDNILHEVAGLCGSSHKDIKHPNFTGGSEGPNPSDPCEVHSRNWCSRLGLH